MACYSVGVAAQQTRASGGRHRYRARRENRQLASGLEQAAAARLRDEHCGWRAISMYSTEANFCRARHGGIK